MKKKILILILAIHDQSHLWTVSLWFKNTILNNLMGRCYLDYYNYYC